MENTKITPRPNLMWAEAFTNPLELHPGFKELGFQLKKLLTVEQAMKSKIQALNIDYSAINAAFSKSQVSLNINTGYGLVNTDIGAPTNTYQSHHHFTPPMRIVIEVID